jgi:hypothetical protein
MNNDAHMSAMTIKVSLRSLFIIGLILRLLMYLDHQSIPGMAFPRGHRPHCAGPAALEAR